MALVDVTELLIDPDFIDSVTIIHRTPTINSMGENTLIEASVVTIGSVQPASGKSLMRVPDALRVESIYSFYVKGEIVSDGTSSYPDIISYQGNRYEVKNIQDFINWPANNGWCEGICVREIPAL